ncbi:MAG: A/G-specific adenine glycosylase [Flavipsychrobacter sp.]|nr:A/G-specific adenine glycosylase [Flavipsychrobacter sp.]
MAKKRNEHQFFTRKLLEWHHTVNDRQLPWKEERDPYRIWLSEVILQQTRAQQGLPYYLKFIEAYPTVTDLAAAAEDDVFRLWQGLGYYSRCKNMLATARIITNDHNGVFPETYEGLLKLKGIGPYTAAAIASFAFGRPVAVVDGNVYRVLSRYMGIATPIDSTEGKKQFALLATDLLDGERSAAYNQAIMDFGATVCTPAGARCADCVLAANCVANRQETVDLLPVKSKKIKVKERHFTFILLHHKGRTWIGKRGAGDIWENLHQPLLYESQASTSTKELARFLSDAGVSVPENDIIFVARTKQRLTHQLIRSELYTIEINSDNAPSISGGSWLRTSEIKKLAFPKTLISFLQNYLYF